MVDIVERIFGRNDGEMVVEEEEGELELRRDLDFEIMRKCGLGEFLGTGNRRPGWGMGLSQVWIALAGYRVGLHLPRRTGGI